jgi:hypothetical protein
MCTVTGVLAPIAVGCGANASLVCDDKKKSVPTGVAMSATSMRIAIILPIASRIITGNPQSS